MAALLLPTLCAGALALSLLGRSPQESPGTQEETPTTLGHVYFVAEDSAFAQLVAPRIAAFDSVFPLAFDPTTDQAKADPALGAELERGESLEQSRNAQALVLSGGSFMGWYHLAYPKGSVSYLPQVLVDAAKSKKPLFAVGGACAFLGGGVVVSREDLDEPQRNPRLAQDAPEARVNLDLGPGLMFGSDSWKDSSPQRLLQAMHANQVQRAAYFVGSVMLEFDRATRTLIVRGPGRVLIFDVTRARSFPRGFRAGRLSSLGEGDHWKVGSAPILMGEGKQLAEPRWISADALPRDGRNLNSDKPQATSRASGLELLEWLERPRRQKTTLEGLGAFWSMDWDERSQGQRKRDAAGRRTWLNLPFDCNWNEAR